jgi:hypothetical protein
LAQLPVDGFELEMVIVLLEWRIASGVSEEIAEHAVVEDSKCGTNRCLSIPEWIPRHSNSGFNV